MKKFKIVEHRYNQESMNYRTDEGEYMTHQYTPVVVSIEPEDYELEQNEYEINANLLSHLECIKLLNCGKFEYETDIRDF